MQPDDLGAFSTLSDPCLHPDGSRVAFVVTRMDLERDRYVREIWLWNGTEARPFTRGPSDTGPRWSPDGTRLAFLRGGAEAKDPPQVAVMPADGGEAAVLTAFDLGARQAEWSPDGSLLAAIGVVWAEGWAGLTDEERAARPRRIDRFGYRFDGLGWLHDRHAHIYLVDPAGGDPAPLTEGPWHHSGICWRPDGQAVAALCARHQERYLDSGSQAWEVPVGGGDALPLCGVGIWMNVSYDRSGVPHVIGIEDVWGYPAVPVLFRVGASGLEPLTAGLDRSPIPPTPAVQPEGPQWLEDGSCLLPLEDAGRVRVVRLAGDGSLSEVVGGDRLVLGFSSRSDGSVLAFIASGPVDPGELWWCEPSGERRLTGLNQEFSRSLLEPEHFLVESDGVLIDAWVLLPPGDARVPPLLNIHGGPATQYGFGFFDEFQIYAAAGFGVVACNPRGSSGRGEEFLRTPVGRWVEDRPPDLQDLLAVLEAALDRYPRLDPERMGIMGGSYGGFMTARILAVDGRFRSAVPERGLYAFTSMTGTSDIGPRFPELYLGAIAPGEVDTLWRASPLSRAHRITTPCLLLHSESDYRCPVEQAEQMFAVLVANGVEVEMLRFPGEGHELSRSGKPVHRRQRFEAIVDWHHRHLG